MVDSDVIHVNDIHERSFETPLLGILSPPPPQKKTQMVKLSLSTVALHRISASVIRVTEVGALVNEQVSILVKLRIINSYFLKHEVLTLASLLCFPTNSLTTFGGNVHSNQMIKNEHPSKPVVLHLRGAPS